MVRQSAGVASRIQCGPHVPDRRRGARPAESFSLALGIQRRVERLRIELPDRRAHLVNPGRAQAESLGRAGARTVAESQRGRARSVAAVAAHAPIAAATASAATRLDLTRSAPISAPTS